MTGSNGERIVERAESQAMNAVAALLTADDVRLDVEVSTREQVLHQLAALLATRHGLSEANVFESLISRERLGSTGLGHGVAIPHARMKQCDMAAAVLMRTRLAVAFGAPDGKPVSIFLGLIVPRQATEHHLQLLATAAHMFGDRTFREKLRSCTEPELARRLVVDWSDGSM